MPSADRKPQTLYDKVFQAHIVDERDDGTILLYIGQKSARYYLDHTNISKFIDRHLVHEVTSPVVRPVQSACPVIDQCHSKLLKAFETQAGRFEDPTVLLLLPIT